MNSSYHQNNRNYYNNSLKRDNFWSRHSLVVAIDASEIFDRVFCQCGLITVFQEAFTLTALDKRCFAPPIEDHWGRFVNMANTCESFKISARTVADLNNSGFKSVTLLSMARPRNLSNDTNDLASFRKCLRTLNDRRVTVLEPLHSLRRLAQAKRKHLHNVTKWEYLDLAGLSKRKLPPNRDYKQPQPMIAKTTFNVHDTQKIFGPHKSCHCKPLRSPLPSTTSSSSGYSSERSSLTDVPDSPDSTKLTMTPYKNGNFPSPVVNTPRAFVFPSNVPAIRALRDPQRRHSGAGNRHQNHHPGFHGRPPVHNNNDNVQIHVYCPRPDCPQKMSLNKVNEHCRQKHNIRDADWVTAYRFTDNIGKVEMSLRACNVLENTKIPIWFGPALFKYDGVTFYQIVYKRPADVERRIEPIVFFSIQAQLPADEARKYQYEVHLDMPPNQKAHTRNYLGCVQSLELNINELLRNHQRNIVYFSQSYLRKTLSSSSHHVSPFNHNSNSQSSMPKMDITYTIKIMRQSL